MTAVPIISKRTLIPIIIKRTIKAKTMPIPLRTVDVTAENTTESANDTITTITVHLLLAFAEFPGAGILKLFLFLYFLCLVGCGFFVLCFFI